MKDIARLAQVSTSTVSHVINNSRFVSDDIRQRVLTVVAQLDYQPSVLARSLKIKQTRTIGLLVTASDNPFFAEVVSAVESYCNQHQYNLILANTAGDEQRLARSLQTLVQRQVDGLLLMCTQSHLQAQSLQFNLPLVVMDWWPAQLQGDQIYTDAEYGGYLACKTLIEHGHQRIGIITGDLCKSLAIKRLQGYQRALKEAGIMPRSEWISEQDFSFSGGVVGMETLLQLDPAPTAVFACSDSIALGAYHAIWRAGLSIPQHISIIGYDDIALAQYLSPPLSTIHQPKMELGRLAVETLLARMKDPNKKTQTILLKPSLVLRESLSRM